MANPTDVIGIVAADVAMVVEGLVLIAVKTPAKAHVKVAEAVLVPAPIVAPQLAVEDAEAEMFIKNGRTASKKNKGCLAIWSSKEYYIHCYKRLPIGL